MLWGETPNDLVLFSLVINYWIKNKKSLSSWCATLDLIILVLHLLSKMYVTEITSQLFLSTFAWPAKTY